MSWEIDPTHSVVEFSVVHLMISTVKGRFSDVSGTLHLDPKEPEKSWVKAPQRDAHLRSADFLDVSRFPNITFESTRVKLLDQHSSLVEGNFCIRGISRPVTFQVKYTGRNQDLLTGAWRIGLTARTNIDRRDFGMTFNQGTAESLLISYQTHIEIHMEAVWL